jgi:ribosomal protein S15
MLAASAARPRLVSGGVSRKATRQSRGFRDRTACRAAEDEEGTSILGSLSMDDDEAGNVTLDGAGFDDELNLTDDALDDDAPEEEEDDATAGMMRQQKYTLGPSRQYVLYIAKKNAIKTWTKDGRGGPGTNWGCLEVQIAVATEKIRNMVLHIREFPHDLKCKNRLIELVSARRRMLDKLSWTDVDAYIHVRDSLKIRHVYRMEALIGRYAPYKYTQENRKRAPGRKVAMRLKKTKRLLNRRLANQLRQGKPKQMIFATKMKIKGRSWTARAYDEAKCILNDKPVPHILDPLDLP